MVKQSQKTVFVLHTSFALVEVLGALFKEHIPGVRIVNIVDDSLLSDVRSAGRVVPSVARRMIGYATGAQSGGADAIFNACSSVGEVADVIRRTVDIPVVKVDERMAEQAVSCGSRIAVVATVQSTLDPTVRLIEGKAKEAGKTITIRRHLVDGAFEALIAGDSEKHDRMVSDEIGRAAAQTDVVVLAQASMARLVPGFAGKLLVPLLASPTLGVLQLKEVLDAQGSSVTTGA